MELFTEYGTLLIILAGLFGFFMAWGVGANDVANAMGTSVGSKASYFNRHGFRVCWCLLSGRRGHFNYP